MNEAARQEQCDVTYVTLGYSQVKCFTSWYIFEVVARPQAPLPLHHMLGRGSLLQIDRPHLGSIDALHKATHAHLCNHGSVVPYEALIIHGLKLLVRLEGSGNECLLVEREPEAALDVCLRGGALASITPRQEV
jgi:hypothetical protein